MNATNTFQDGLIMDSHPLATPNNVLTNCLNGTLITYNGNELILQNDVGNSKITKLKDGFVPIGLKEFGGILYIFSVNPDTNISEIGTFPSPDYSKEHGKLEYVYRPLNNFNGGEFTTNLLNFDINHPLQIDCQKSYDASVNLIFTDNKNIPRLINTRFSLYGGGEYKIIDRKGDEDTNQYEESDFEYSTSLNKIVNSIVQINFDGIFTGGNLPVGTYTFYFTLADSDDNESDFIGQSSIVTCHKGNLNDPFSIDGGIENENSYKQVGFTLEEIPKQFSRVYVYYSRNSSDASGNALTTYKKINKYFDIPALTKEQIKLGKTLKSVSFIISGFEQNLDVDSTTINTNYLNVDVAKTQSIAQDILFYGNVKKQDQHYQDLEEFSKTIYGKFVQEMEIGNVGPDFTRPDTDTLSDDVAYGYYNAKNIYNYVGYWPGEYYRFGIVYILDDYSLTPVFNIRGNVDNNEQGIYFVDETMYPMYLSETSSIIKPIGIKFNISSLPNYVKGYFFVRQKRLKTILAQGVRIGSDQDYSKLPLLYKATINGDTKEENYTSTTEILWTFNPNYSKYNYDTGEYTYVHVIILPDGTILHEGADADSFFRKESNIYKLPETIYQYAKTNYSDNSKPKTFTNVPLGWFTEGFINIPSSTTSVQTRHGTWFRSAKYKISVIFDNYVFSAKYPNSNWSNSVLVKLQPSLIGTSALSKLTIGSKTNYNLEKEKNKSDEIFGNLHPKPDAMICPEYEVNQQLYNQLFTGGKLCYEKVGKFDIDQNAKIFFTKNFRQDLKKYRQAYVIGVPENTPAIRANSNIYSSVAGNAAEAHRCKVPFSRVRIIYDAAGTPTIDGIKMKDDDADVTWVCRGIWGPYVGIEDVKDDYGSQVYDVVNIRIPNYDSTTVKDFVTTRINDTSEYYPITQRFDTVKTSVIAYSGDCYVCNFAHTMLRNFADPSFPTSTEIADPNTWYKGYRVNYDTNKPLVNPGESSDAKYRILDKDDVVLDTDSLMYLNRSDINAVPIGHIFITQVCSSTNLCMRSTDSSNVTERATFNSIRKFYPLERIDFKIPKKLSDSYIQNGAYEKSLGEQIYNLQEDVPALKTNFSNRIVYSHIAVKDSYANNFRVFRKTAFQDYTRQYGEIVKILNWYNGYLFCVFEHAVALIEVNERAIATNSQSGFAYIDTNKVLSDKPRFLSTEYGSQWGDSVIQTATGIYGIDTIAKKIWHYGDTFEILSDLKIQKFLKDNLELTEQETQPDVTKVNVKTHYNKHKQDIMFTFFKIISNDYLGWNICYNEITKKWTTFYSWIPSYSGNINNTFYSFDADYSLSRNQNRLNAWYENIVNRDDKNNNYLWEHNKENNWCNWYGEQHPFEFEFIVADNPHIHKIFNNLKMIANKTKPESFHFEVVGEVYDFKEDKPNMYYRQEMTKENWAKNNNADISYDKNYKVVTPKRNPKSRMFPLTVSHVDRTNKIYDSYQRLTSKSQDYQSMSGSEIVFDRTTNDFDVATHINAYPLDGYEWQAFALDGDTNTEQLKQYYKSHNIQIRFNNNTGYWEKKIEYGRRLGNCKYDEDNWNIQIPPINYAEKNENWTDKPPMNIAMNPVPEDLLKHDNVKVPQDTEFDYWGPLKQTRIRDKYVRIRVRYSGDDLAIISAIITQYKESYS